MSSPAMKNEPYHEVYSALKLMPLHQGIRNIADVLDQYGIDKHNLIRSGMIYSRSIDFLTNRSLYVVREDSRAAIGELLSRCD